MNLELFDTNVLLAAVLPHREDHEIAQWVINQSKLLGRACVCVHSLAEAYSTLSGKLGIPPKEAFEILEFALRNMKILAFAPTDHMNALRRMVLLGIGGAGIYDALIAELALRNQCHKIYTFNFKHFIRLGEDVAGILETPV